MLMEPPDSGAEAKLLHPEILALIIHGCDAARGSGVHDGTT